MASDRRELYLIDGNSLVYRAFFALPESIATSTGTADERDLRLRLDAREDADRARCAANRGRLGRRYVRAQGMYGEYKAQRATRPDLLKEQWPHFEPLVDAFGYRNVAVEGYEADDVIASIAERAREQGVSVTIVTGDRDTSS